MCQTYDTSLFLSSYPNNLDYITINTSQNSLFFYYSRTIIQFSIKNRFSSILANTK